MARINLVFIFLFVIVLAIAAAAAWAQRDTIRMGEQLGTVVGRAPAPSVGEEIELRCVVMKKATGNRQNEKGKR